MMQKKREYMRSMKQWAITFFTIAILGSVLAAIIPPLQSPDEGDHLKRAYLLSQFSGTVNEPGKSTGGYFDDSFGEYLALFGDSISGKPDARLTRSLMDRSASIRWSHESHLADVAGSAPYFPLGYLPQAIGLRIGESLDLGVGASYRLARALTLITVAAIIAYAFTIFPPNALVLCILALPMTIFQMSSASADGMSFAWTVLAASLFRRGMAKDELFPLWWSGLLIVAPFMLATSRPQLIAILILAPAVFFVRNDRRAFTASLIAALLAVAWVVYGAVHTVDLRSHRAITSGQVVSFYMHSPLALFEILWRTISDRGMESGYYRMFVGILGWLDRPMSPITYTVSGVALICTAALSLSRKIGAIERSVLALVTVSAVLLTLIALLITWTDHPSKFISGVQGRYFTAPAILAAYALGDRFANDRMMVVKIAAGGIFLAFSATMTVSTLIWRYYL